nr:MAG TPA: hypothetical protein [Caudoviricetes sp.]
MRFVRNHYLCSAFKIERAAKGTKKGRELRVFEIKESKRHKTR